MTNLTKTQRQVLKVLERISDQVRQDDAAAQDWAHCLETELDYGLENDAFGTEGQCDPRGDRRNGEWSFFGEIEGVDD